MSRRSAGAKRPHVFFLVGLALCAIAVPVATPAADTTAPPPQITRSYPDSRTNDNTPRLTGSVGTVFTSPDGIRAFATGDIFVEIFTNVEDCNEGTPRWHGAASEFVTFGIEVSVPDDSITTFYARAMTPEGPTQCSGGFEYQEISIPAITDMDPDSPANDRTPLLKGIAPPGTDFVEIFTAFEDCAAGAPRWSGLTAQFMSPGIEVSVPDDSVTTFYARSVNLEAVSRCSSGFTYTEASAPAITASDPESPANNNTPRLKGEIAGNDIIEIFDDLQECRSGPPRWHGTAEEFASTGIQVTVSDDGLTAFYARGLGPEGQSGCSPGFTYEERSATPPAPSKRKDCFGTATIVGTEGDDVLVGTSGKDIINGLGGDDVIMGLEGDDVICGSLGNDEIHGGPGNDRIEGDFIANSEIPGNDTIYGDEGDDLIFGDFVDAGPLPVSGGSDLIDGGDGSDFIKGDSLGFTSGADERYGGDDTIYGGYGADFIAGDGIEGGAGADRIVGGDDVLYGGPGNDRLRGEEIPGGAGQDSVLGGRDRLYGGIGDDWLRGDDFDTTGDDTADSLNGGDDLLYGEDGNDRLEGDFLPGGPGGDSLSGGHDRLYGGAGSDVLLGDAIRGDDGSDTAALGDDFMDGGVGNDWLYGDDITGVELSSFGGDNLLGGADDDTLDCEEGADMGDGGAGTDSQQNCEVALGIP